MAPGNAKGGGEWSCGSSAVKTRGVVWMYGGAASRVVEWSFEIRPRFSADRCLVGWRKCSIEEDR